MLNSRWCNQLLQSLHSKPNPSPHWASRTSNLMFPQALSRSDCCLNIRLGEGKSDLGNKGGNPGGLWWVFMEWYVCTMHINIIYRMYYYTSPRLYPLLLSTPSSKSSQNISVSSLQASLQRSVGSLGPPCPWLQSTPRWSHQPVGHKSSPTFCHGKPPVTRADLFEGY